MDNWRPVKRKADGADVALSVQSMRSHMGQTRDAIVARDARERQELRAERERLAAPLPEGRAWLRRRKDVSRAAARIEERLAKDKIADFDAGVAIYLDAYAQETSRKALRRPGKAAASGGQDRQQVIFEEYLQNVCGEQPPARVQSDRCPTCSAEMVVASTKGMVCCPKCGYSLVYIHATVSSVLYDDTSSSTFRSQRICHFRECVAQLQGKEKSVVGADVLDSVMRELCARGVAFPTPVHVRDALKRLKLRKAYDQVSQVTSLLTGVPPPSLPPDVEETFRLMFIAMQPAFEKHCPPTRKNFLSYNYCLYKFLELFGYTHMLDHIALLKCRDKLRKQDELFQLICTDLNWTYIPST